MKQQKTWHYGLLIALVVATIAIIGYTDLVVRPGYWTKTLVKAPLFFAVPFLYAWVSKTPSPLRFLRPNGKGLKLGLGLGLGIYAVVVGVYLLVNQLVDLSGIQTSLEGNLGIDKSNFLLIGLYVSVCNSFLEEWFFRGFVFQRLRNLSRPVAYGVSSLAFGVYHIAIMEGMFGLGVMALVLMGLFAGGTIFNYLNEKSQSLYASWFCHSFANFAMNTIALMIFLN